MIILFLLTDTGSPIPKKIYASPAKACKLSVIAHNVAPQPYGIIGSATFNCGTGNSILCENVTAVLKTTNINTGQMYTTSNTLSLFCSKSGNIAAFLELPSGTYQYVFYCIGDDTQAYYVNETGLFSR